MKSKKKQFEKALKLISEGATLKQAAIRCRVSVSGISAYRRMHTQQTSVNGKESQPTTSGVVLNALQKTFLNLPPDIQTDLVSRGVVQLMTERGQVLG